MRAKTTAAETIPESTDDVEKQEVRIPDYLTGDLIKETPKEKVRQDVARRLVNLYAFDPACMVGDFKVKVDGKLKKIDIAIFSPGTEHTVENLIRAVICRPEPKLGKRQVIKMRDYDQAHEDLAELEDIVPVCEGNALGRPHKNQPPKKVVVVSWNQFSGSCNRKYGRGRDTIAKRSNPVMAGWQTEWAARWAGCGISRGIPSTRTHLPMEWVQGQQGEIIAQARAAISLREPVKLNPDQFNQLQGNPSIHVLTNLVSELVTRELKERIKPLIELANRGIQLETERQARADIESRYQESQIQVTQLKSILSNRPNEAALRIENEHLKGEIERLNWALEDGEKERGKLDPHEIFHQSGRPPPRGPDCQREQNI